MQKFIVIEGIDGSGKSTLCDYIYNLLNSKNIPTKKFSEPTQFETGKKIRSFLKGEINLSEQEIIKLFLDDRELSVKENINRNLKIGYNVILDRYFYSMAAYQGGETYSPKSILELNIKRGFPIPDLLIFLDLPVEVSLNRVMARKSADHFETKEKQIKIKNNFERILPEHTFRVNAELPRDKVRDVCEKEILKLFETI